MSHGRHPWRLRLLLWLYSNRNIAGSVLALFGPALYLGGVVDRGWLWITLGLYATGALLAPSPPQLEHEIAESLSSEQMLRALDALIERSQTEVPAHMVSRLESIKRSVHEVLPRLGGAVSEHAFTVRQTILSYLPDTLASYVALPRVFRGTHLELLQKVVVSVSQDDADALLVQHNFLREKFGRRSLL
jgi:hypothetical protein